MSSLERARPLFHEVRFARPVWGKREWDENENEAESWQVERTALERENRELRQANEILRKASAYFAQAELDRRFRP
jgi:transposase